MDTRIDLLDTQINRLATAGYSQKNECHKYYREYSHGKHFTRSVNGEAYRHALPIFHISSTYGDAIKLILITLVALVVGLTLTRTATPAATPTPSRPTYSEEEVITVVKVHIQKTVIQSIGQPC